MHTDDYQLQRQAMATLVQERSNVPFVTLQVFSDAEVQAVFTLTANCSAVVQ